MITQNFRFVKHMIILCMFWIYSFLMPVILLVDFFFIFKSTWFYFARKLSKINWSWVSVVNLYRNIVRKKLLCYKASRYFHYWKTMISLEYLCHTVKLRWFMLLWKRFFFFLILSYVHFLIKSFARCLQYNLYSSDFAFQIWSFFGLHKVKFN